MHINQHFAANYGRFSIAFISQSHKFFFLYFALESMKKTEYMHFLASTRASIYEIWLDCCFFFKYPLPKWDAYGTANAADSQNQLIGRSDLVYFFHLLHISLSRFIVNICSCFLIGQNQYKQRAWAFDCHFFFLSRCSATSAMMRFFSFSHARNLH